MSINTTVITLLALLLTMNSDKIEVRISGEKAGLETLNVAPDV